MNEGRDPWSAPSTVVIAERFAANGGRAVKSRHRAAGCRGGARGRADGDLNGPPGLGLVAAPAPAQPAGEDGRQERLRHLADRRRAEVGPSIPEHMVADGAARHPALDVLELDDIAT